MSIANPIILLNLQFETITDNLDQIFIAERLNNLPQQILVQGG
jgi:hypothetical protein